MSDTPLKRIIWDYNVDTDDLLAFLTGEKESLHHFSREMLYVRILERLSWYEILESLPIQVIKRMLREDIISKLRSDSMRRKYDYAARVLHNQPLPPSRWDPENRNPSEYPILSDRRHGAE